MAYPDIWAVLVASLIPMIFGALWYSKLLFGNQWMGYVDMTEEEIVNKAKGKEPQMYGITFILSIVMSYVMAHIIIFAETYYGSSGLWGGILSGFFIWVGFVATIMYQSVTFEFRPTGLYLINSMYNLATLVAMGALLGIWH